MFKVSQELRLDTSGSTTRKNTTPNANSEHDYTFGKYQKTPDADVYPVNDHSIFIAPELTDTSKIQLLHFPNSVVHKNTNINFIIRRNGAKGNFEVKVESPSGVLSTMVLKVLDPERIEIDFNVNEVGLYKVFMKCNSVPVHKSPLIIVVICNEAESMKT
ncbi:filamin-B-like [Teleopsis dalmanni]|uniref:filamin-B-like n=1 Tax=Teleopsis dalmanni TaxID=139649 RepID=UPI0018CF31DE|nr:filamin-B-like [Teleopsis dalmanni]